MKVMALKKIPKSLSLCNAYIDQALMNFSYEEMKSHEQASALMLITQMIEKFNLIRGR